MDVEILYKLMDEIMEIHHQIISYLVDFSKVEIEGTRIKKNKVQENKILKNLFEQLQKLYRQLQEKIVEIEELDFIELDDETSEKDLLEQNLEKKGSFSPLTCKSGVEDLKAYLETAYKKLRYISIIDGNGNEMESSIYKNTGCEALRNAEYNIQMQNLDIILERIGLQGKTDKFSFYEKGIILEHIAQEKFYKDYAFKQMNRYILDLSKKSQDMKPKEFDSQMRKFIEQKYILYYVYLNTRYNGILQENDIDSFRIVKKYIDEGMAPMLLKMSQYDIDANINISLLDQKDGFKEVINNITSNNDAEKKMKKLSQKQQDEEKIADENDMEI